MNPVIKSRLWLTCSGRKIPRGRLSRGHHDKARRRLGLKGVSPVTNQKGAGMARRAGLSAAGLGNSPHATKPVVNAVTVRAFQQVQLPRMSSQLTLRLSVMNPMSGRVRTETANKILPHGSLSGNMTIEGLEYFENPIRIHEMTVPHQWLHVSPGRAWLPVLHSSAS